MNLLFSASPCVSLQSKAGPVTDYVRGEDVLDIWFDSGASWAAVLEGTSKCVLHVQVDSVNLIEIFYILMNPNINTNVTTFDI